MKQFQQQIQVQCQGRGMYEITSQVSAWLATTSVQCGIVNVFVEHTSCSLVIQENADVRVRDDLETFFSTLAPDGAHHYQHNDEGDDDMPSHIRSMLTDTSVNIPIRHGKMVLGIWQGLFLYEHRTPHNNRRITLHLLGQ